MWSLCCSLGLFTHLIDCNKTEPGEVNASQLEQILDLVLVEAASVKVHFGQVLEWSKDLKENEISNANK